MFKPFTVVCAVLFSALVVTNAQAACTYSEALMAFNNGNLVRGQALMNMAARDGDQRAVRFLASNNIKDHRDQEKGNATSRLQLVLDSFSTKQSTAEKVN